MPTYEYKCPNCGHFEVEQHMTDEALTVCPSCGAAVKRLIPRKLSIQFKGPGFHVNDYAANGPKASPAADKPAESPDRTASATAADAKPVGGGI